MGRRSHALAICVVVVLALLPAALGMARPGASPRIHLQRAGGGTPGTITGAAARAARGELLTVDPAALARAKSRTPTRAPDSTRASSRVLDPVATVTAEGLNDPNFTPSDSTGAIGPNSYIEVVNSTVGLYDRTLGLQASGTLETWWGEPGATAFDPQVIWDPTTKRFYYAGDAVFNNSDNRIAFGFSKTSSPSGFGSGWCRYDVGYGSEFPDFPKLGDSKNFAIVGVNVFHGNTYARSDAFAISKPGSGTTCPRPRSLKFGIGLNLKVNGAKAFTPVPANEIDTARKGWILTRARALPSGKLGVFTVTKNRDGFPVIQQSGASINVGSYDVPPNAPQNGNFLLDTSDARLTQAVAAKDPTQGGRFAIWTQHAVFGGAGAMERWYEIDPAARNVLQTGTVSDSTLYVYNGAISPDRVVDGATKAFGGDMVLGFTTSSATDFPAIQMVSKLGSNPVSSFVLIQQSPGYDEDFDCPLEPGGKCRWGDYSAATPDPKADTGGSAGVVWLTNMWTADATTTGGTTGVSWRTWNWATTP
jgi:hypothetical protein